jgi:hypothetical protein
MTKYNKDTAKAYHSNPHPTKIDDSVSEVYLGNPLDRFNKPPHLHAVISVKNKPFLYDNSTIYPDSYELDAGIPFIVETKHSDGSGGLRIVFAHNTGDALKCVNSSTLVSAAIVPCSVHVIVPTKESESEE